ncbi:redoxin domain-containing protein [Psychromicrobium lacuslunae]|uniref:HTH merR-type domain-containing protein n=1 Tax=Psychromicrobium lacuslunae TaxID=1618207 RepID=A0A0D4BZ18_9MICC|nr:redoxin domain-containing protein [Psychromicrobium lacuslunae]AJT41361.1 hypothetical protein UM93_07265 [Psychromicrobium lacuslunae]
MSVLAKELARQCGTSVKALRYFEQCGLLKPSRLSNGYRDYSAADAFIVEKILELRGLGFSVEGTKPFIDCLRLGHEQGDECADSLIAYRTEISRIEATVAQLNQYRELLQQRLYTAAARGFPNSETMEVSQMPSTSYEKLPENLPVPQDDGLADHLPGLSLPELNLPSTSGETIDLAAITGRWVLFIYPSTGVPGVDMPEGWDNIPGARGCTPEACGFRDNIDSLRAAGAEAIYGLSGQGLNYQQELAKRLHLPYPLLSDPQTELAEALQLPRFDIAGQSFYQRLTLIINYGVIEHAFYPIFPPDQHANQVHSWLRENPMPGAS